jgi:hypothetical protein
VTRYEAQTLWQIVLALRNRNYGVAEKLTRDLLRKAQAEFVREDHTNSALEAEHE